MTTGLTARPEPNVRVEMKAHRERLRQAVHPGVTQRDSGLSREELAWLSSGVCRGMADATERGERLAHRLLAVLAVALLLALGLTAVSGPRPMVTQTVEAGR